MYPLAVMYTLLLSSNCAPDTTPGIRMYPKNSTSQKNFNNSIKKAGESVLSPAIRTVYKCPH